jgi:hypothetical protein
MPVNFEEADKAIRSAATVEAGRNTRNMTIGWWSARLKEADEWTKHGYANEAAYRDAAGVSTGVWGRYTRIAGCFPNLLLSEFVKMSAENAELLGGMSSVHKASFMWRAKANEMKAEDFKREVLKENANIAGLQPKDMRVKFSLPLFEAQRSVIKAGIKDFAREHQIKDEGTSLEWLVLEYSQRKTFRKFIVDHLPLLRAAHHGDKESLGTYIQAMSDMLGNLKG